jgi:hypothetical protein
MRPICPAALIALREAFKKAGMRTQERQITYAIEHTRQLKAWNPSWYFSGQDRRPWLEQLAGKGESLFSYILFELPSGYGMVPSRALATLSLFILVFSLVYMGAFLMARGRAGIWVKHGHDRLCWLIQKRAEQWSCIRRLKARDRVHSSGETHPPWHWKLTAATYPTESRPPLPLWGIKPARLNSLGELRLVPTANASLTHLPDPLTLARRGSGLHVHACGRDG